MTAKHCSDKHAHPTGKHMRLSDKHTRAIVEHAHSSEGHARSIGKHMRSASPHLLSRIVYSGLLLVTVCVACLCVLVCLTTTCLELNDTGQLTQNMKILSWASLSSYPWLICGVLGLLVMVSVLRFAWHRGACLDSKRACIIFVIVSTVGQGIWLALMQTSECFWGDTWMVSAFVKNAAASPQGLATLAAPPAHITASAIDHNALLYLSCYPFQCGLFWYFWFMHALFGPFWHLAMQVVNVVANEVTLVCILLIGRHLLSSPRARRCLAVLVILCLPLWWLSAFVYGNALGMALGFVFLLMQVHALKQKLLPMRLRWVAASCIPLAACLCIKLTFILFAIGALLAWIVALCMERTWACGFVFLVMFVCLVGAQCASCLPTYAYERAVGVSLRDGITRLNHLEMGLRDDMHEFSVRFDDCAPTPSPGGWSRHAMRVWLDNRGDQAAQNREALANIAEDIEGFVHDPKYFLWFFTTKLATLWSDPTFQSLYYSSRCANASDVPFNPVDLSAPHGIFSQIASAFLDGYETVVFFGALVACCVAVRRFRSFTSVAASLLPCVFFAGFGCYLLWEAKSVYTFPFFIALLPVAAYGCDRIFSSKMSRFRLLSCGSAPDRHADAGAGRIEECGSAPDRHADAGSGRMSDRHADAGAGRIEESTTE